MSFVHHEHSVTATKLTFVDASENYARLVQIPLIPPETIDSDAKNRSKDVNRNLHRYRYKRESDPSYVISGGHHFIGAMIRDKNHFNAGAPCLGIEG